MMKNKVGIYLRLSREDEKDKESGSIKNQRAILMDYIKEHHLNFIAEYVDDGISGTTFQRPGFKRLIEDVKKKKIDTVLTKDTSRLGRDHIEFGYYVEKFFPENNVRYIAVNDNIDTKNTENDMLLFKSAYNDMYVKDISKKIRTSLYIKKKQGEFVGAYAPYGYQKDIYDKHKLVIEETSANIVRRIFNLFVNHHSITTIADTLTKDNIPIPSIQKGMNRGIKSSLFGIWTSRTITDILTNPTYIGNLTQGRSKKINYKSKKRIHTKREDWIIKENSCPKIIDEELFFLANTMYQANLHKYKKNSNDLLLKGFVYCAECGHKISFRKISNKYIYGECNYYLKYKKYNACTTHSIKYETLEKLILNEIRNLLKKVNQEKIIQSIYQSVLNEVKEKNNKRITFLRKGQEVNQIKLDSLYEDKLAKLINQENYFRMKEKIETETKKMKQEINHLEEKNRTLETNNKEKQLLKNNPIDKIFLSTLIEKITLTRDKKINIYYRVNCNF